MDLIQVTFHDPAAIDDAELKFAVIVSQYQDHWVLCRHRERNTWECPGGHREAGESIEKTASRELWEETGCVKAEIYPVCAYKVWNYGMLYYAEISQMGELPGCSEIAETMLVKHLPENLTYLGIHDKLVEKVQCWLHDNKKDS